MQNPILKLDKTLLLPIKQAICLKIEAIKIETPSTIQF